MWFFVCFIFLLFGLLGVSVGEFLGFAGCVFGVVDGFVGLDSGVLGGVVFYRIADCDLRCFRF